MKIYKSIYVLLSDRYVRFTAVGALIFWCVAFMLYVLFVAPLYKKRDELIVELNNIKSEYIFRESISHQVKDLDKYLGIIGNIEEKLSKELKGSDVLIQMTDLFSKHDIDVLNENYSKIKSENGYRYIDADFKVKASYQNLRFVLDDFSDLSFLVYVTKITMIRDHEYIVAEMQTRISSFEGDIK